MEWVEVTAKTVDKAIEGGLEELGLSREEAEVEVIQEPEKGFMGFGGTEAIVRIKKAPAQKKRRRRRGRRSGGGDANRGGGQKDRQADSEPRGDGGRRGGGQQGRGRGQEQSGGRRPEKEDRQQRGKQNRQRRGESVDKTRSEPSAESQQDADINEQAQILQEFMEGLVDAFGLEGNTATRIEDDIIFVDVTGEQTEALIGARGAILQSILDLMKIVVQRKTHHRARIRLDIAGYAERRREALGIYSKRLSEQVLADGQEVMLEPMHPGDRKVVHDAVAEIEGVRSWSEGEEPNRSVVLGLAPGFSPSGDTDEE